MIHNRAYNEFVFFHICKFLRGSQGQRIQWVEHINIYINIYLPSKFMEQNEALRSSSESDILYISKCKRFDHLKVEKRNENAYNTETTS